MSLPKAQQLSLLPTLLAKRGWNTLAWARGQRGEAWGLIRIGVALLIKAGEYLTEPGTALVLGTLSQVTAGTHRQHVGI